MWRADRRKLIKIVLHEHGEYVETPWAEDLGPSTAADEDGRLAIDLGGLGYADVCARLMEDCGRGPTDDEPGSAYLAVPDEQDAQGVLDHLAGAELPMRITLVHPVESPAEGG